MRESIILTKLLTQIKHHPRYVRLKLNPKIRRTVSRRTSTSKSQSNASLSPESRTMQKHRSIIPLLCLIVAVLCYIKIGCNARAGDTGQIAVPAAPHLWVYCRPRCTPCYHGKRAVKESTEYDLHVIEVSDQNPPPKWIVDACNDDPDLGYPFWVWRDRKGRAIYVSGFTDFKTLHRRIRGTR